VISIPIITALLACVGGAIKARVLWSRQRTKRNFLMLCASDNPDDIELADYLSKHHSLYLDGLTPAQRRAEWLGETCGLIAVVVALVILFGPFQMPPDAYFIP
jgi:hypothetical protein